MVNLVIEGDLFPSDTTYQVVKVDNALERKEVFKFFHMFKTHPTKHSKIVL